MVFGNEKIRFKRQILLRWRVENFHLKCLIQGWRVGSNNACVNECGCIDSARYSNGKKKGANNRKNGNRYLAKRFYERQKATTNAAVATKALTHQVARAC
jgi:hypothetical protein